MGMVFYLTMKRNLRGPCWMASVVTGAQLCRSVLLVGLGRHTHGPAYRASFPTPGWKPTRDCEFSLSKKQRPWNSRVGPLAVAVGSGGRTLGFLKTGLRC